MVSARIMDIESDTKVERKIAPVVQEARPQFKQPSMYEVFMHNDDFTPMEFVVVVLEMFFHLERHTATAVMYQVHMEGKASCGIYTKDVAETKVDQVTHYARRHEHPLLCSIEAVESS
jgi:ATP-dependent Clp protease adaptor protein ClpS